MNDLYLFLGAFAWTVAFVFLLVVLLAEIGRAGDGR